MPTVQSSLRGASLVLALFAASASGCTSSTAESPRPGGDRRVDIRSFDEECSVAVLNRLRNAVNAAYGYRDGVPRVNLGPCGRFARDFREAWNAKFRQKADIAFVMSNDSANCHHVLVRLPDGTYFDGGSGVVTREALLALYPDSRVEEMRAFDPKLLDERSYGLGRSYPLCPNYSDGTTARLIRVHLALLPEESLRLNGTRTSEHADRN